ncbi:MAG: Nitrate reductase 1, delta subunit [Mitsuokella multacida]|jgi:nitrate reductase molybdenum cofactor assembly chaperone NarJ/NarW
MAMEDYQKVLMLTSHLFEYPDVSWWQDLPECHKALQEIEAQQPASVFKDFLAFVEESGAKEYEDLYVRSFDFSQNTNLYLTTQERTDFGKQSEEMHHYKELFLRNGLDVEKQLPDYLPALLELAASLPAEKAAQVLTQIKPRVELLRTRFIDAKLPHAFLLDLVLTETAGLEANHA